MDIQENAIHYNLTHQNQKVFWLNRDNLLNQDKWLLKNRISEIKAINKELAKVYNDKEKLQFEFLKDFRDMIDKRIIKISDRIDRRNKK